MNGKSESLLIAAQNNEIKMMSKQKMIIRKNDNKNSKFTLCGDREKTINDIISECSKIAQKEYKSRHNWVGKVIRWVLCKRLKFDDTDKWYMHELEFVLEMKRIEFSGFWYTNRSPNPDQTTRPRINQLEEKNFFIVPLDRRLKIKKKPNT